MKHGLPIRTRVNTFDYTTSRHPLTHLFDSTGSEVSGSPVALGTNAGIYADDTLLMPRNVAWEQTLLYMDSNHDVLDTGIGISTRFLSEGGEGDTARPGDKLYPWIQLPDDPTRLVLARVYDSGMNLISTPLVLARIAPGLYVDLGSFTMPNTAVVTVIVTVYDDDEAQSPSLDYPPKLYNVERAVVEAAAAKEEVIVCNNMSVLEVLGCD